MNAGFVTKKGKKSGKPSPIDDLNFCWGQAIEILVSRRRGSERVMKASAIADRGGMKKLLGEKRRCVEKWGAKWRRGARNADSKKVCIRN